MIVVTDFQAGDKSSGDEPQSALATLARSPGYLRASGGGYTDDVSDWVDGIEPTGSRR